MNRSQLAGEINAARCLVVKLRGRITQHGLDDDRRIREATTRWHLDAAERHLIEARDAWNER